MANASPTALEQLDPSLNPEQAQLNREDYFAWISEQTHGRSERISGHVVAMAPERGAHLRVKAAVWLALRNAIAQTGVECQHFRMARRSARTTAITSLMLSLIAAPDDRQCYHRPNPVVVVEVLLPGTRGLRHRRKLAGYVSIASIAHYLIVHPTRRQVIHHHRTPSRIDTTIRQGGEIALDPPGVTIAIDQFYAVDLAASSLPEARKRCREGAMKTPYFEHASGPMLVLR